MQREIKFRAWDKVGKRFIYSTSEEYKREFAFIQFNIGFSHYSPEDLVVQQFTGLKDKNGKEIYEGDIVHYTVPDTVRSGVVKFSDYYNGWSIKDKEHYPLRKFGEYPLELPFFSFSSVKIIGNIFKNPKLLK